MNTELFSALDALQKEKGIPKEYMLEKIEVALMTAFKKDYPNTSIRVYLDDQKKDLKVYHLKNITETVEDPLTEISLEEAKKISSRYNIGAVAEVEFKPKNLGRIAAGTAKQVIIQSIREAERGILIQEYESKKDEMISATVYKIDPVNGNVILNVGKSEAVFMKSEQIPGEVLREGEIIRVYVCEVKNQVKGPVITLSRRHQGLVKRLFELEVPEIQDGTVIIKSIAREAGSRTKMAVYSTNKDVDPIGSCIGAKGMRINNVVKELNNEKIDIIKYSDDPAEFIRAALAPADTIDITVNDDKTCQVSVNPSQLSLAIGKEGQNARLAAKLTGFKIDIKTS